MTAPSYTGNSMAHSPTRARERNNSHAAVLLLLGLFLLALVVISQLGENGIVSWWKLQAQVTDLKAETTSLEARNEELESRIDALLHDPDTLEKIAREKFNMQRPDEEVLMILPLGRAAPSDLLPPPPAPGR